MYAQLKQTVLGWLTPIFASAISFFEILNPILTAISLLVGIVVGLTQLYKFIRPRYLDCLARRSARKHLRDTDSTKGGRSDLGDTD